MQIIARADLPCDFRILPLARLLDVSASRIKRYLRVAVDDEVLEGQVIAKRFTRSVKSPINGVVAASRGGRMLIKARPTQFELRAYIPGVVSNVLRDYGVVIEVMGAVIEGVWGAGGESFGVLKRLVKDPSESLQAQAIDSSCHGAILIGGLGLDNAALERAQDIQVRGIVTGGLSPELVSQAKQLPFPIVVTEGIGTVSMSAPIFRLLTKNQGREAAISGRVQPRWGVVRPEIVIPLPAEATPPTQTQPGMPLVVGTRVRVVRAPYMGAVGTIVTLPTRARLIETGARVRGAKVDLDQEESIFVPLVNLEVLR